MIKTLLGYYRKHEEIFSYLIFGFLTTVVSYASFFVFTRVFALSLIPANVLSWVMAVAFAYLTNRKWVFKSTATDKAVLLEAGSFVLARIFSLIIDTIAMVVFVQWLNVYDLVARAIVSIIVIVLNYVLSKLVIFRKK